MKARNRSQRYNSTLLPVLVLVKFVLTLLYVLPIVLANVEVIIGISVHMILK